MIFRFTLLTCLFIFSSMGMEAQNPVSISGIVRDSITDDPLEAVTVAVDGSAQGSYTDENGYFELSVDQEPPILLHISYVGYRPKEVRIEDEDQGRNLRIAMYSSAEELTEVIVQASSLREKFHSSNTSVESIDARDAQIIPALFGEVDIIKTLQLKPGILSGSEGNSNLYVRGGNSDQNLVLLDGINIYNPSHLFGFFSTFNNDALHSVDIYKGGFPAKYGGRLSSVIDVQTKTPNNKKLSGAGGLGLISSRLLLEGPLFSENVSFLISGRRTYVDVFTEMVNKSKRDNENYNPIPQYRFYDLNGKLTARLSPSDMLTFSGYMGADVFGFKNELFHLDFDWGNRAGSVEWSHSFSKRLFSKKTLFATDYNYLIVSDMEDFHFDLGSRIRDRGFRWDLTYDSPGGHFIQAGAQWVHHQFRLGRIKAGSITDDYDFSSGTDPAGQEWSLFAGDQFSPIESLKLNLGLRYSGFYSNSRTYHRLEPRIALNAMLSDRWSFKSSYARMSQFVHLVSNTGFSLPTDLWYPTTEKVKPQSSDQVVLGLNYLINSSLMLTNEYYYKSMDHQIELKDHAQIFSNDNLEDEFTFGRGYAYGTELGIEKTTGALTGWIGYTLAWVRRGDFEDLEGGRYFPPRYDRRHDVSIVSTYALNDKWSFSATFVYGTGDKAWLPAGRIYLQDIDRLNSFPVVPVYQERNTVTLPGYHRMDLSIVRSFEASWGSHDLNLSFYNLYNRRNPYFLYLDAEMKNLLENGDKLEVPVNMTARQVSLFPILPSISWNFKF